MSTPANSEHSPLSSIYWGSDSESTMSESNNYFSPSRETPTTNPPRPRLSSQPRLFSNIFQAGTDQSHPRQPLGLTVPFIPRPSRNPTQDVNQAIQNMNRAVQTVQDALSNPPTVDLTDSPPIPQNPSRVPDEPRRKQRGSSSSTAQASSSSPEPHSSSNVLHSSRHHELPPSRQSEGLALDGAHAPKRRRLSSSEGEHRGEGHVQTRQQTPEEIEAVDLTEVNTSSELSRALSKQRQDAIKAQMKGAQGSTSEGRTPLSNYKCPICMDTPEDATATVCGHLFCHKCIIETLRWSEEQRQDEETRGKAKGTCPVCRKAMASNDKSGNSRTLIPLEVKLTTRKKGVDVKGKGIAKESPRAKPSSTVRSRNDRDSSTEIWNELMVF